MQILQIHKYFQINVLVIDFLPVWQTCIVYLCSQSFCISLTALQFGSKKYHANNINIKCDYIISITQNLSCSQKKFDNCKKKSSPQCSRRKQIRCVELLKKWKATKYRFQRKFENKMNLKNNFTYHFIHYYLYPNIFYSYSKVF